MNRTRTVAAEETPITLTDARAWLSMESGITEDDPVLTDLLDEVTAYTEARLNGRVFITQTWTVELDASEVTPMIFLPLLPLQEVTSIKVTNDDGEQSTVDASNYQLRLGHTPRIVLSPSGSWPSMREFDSMLITCVVGYGDAATDVPYDLTMLLKGIVLHQYASKGSGINQTVSGQLISLPSMLERMIKSYRLNP